MRLDLRSNRQFGICVRTPVVTFPINPQNLRDSVLVVAARRMKFAECIRCESNECDSSEFRTNKRITEFSAPMRRGRLSRAVDTTDSRQQVIPAQCRKDGEQGEEDPSLSEVPAGPKNAIHSSELRYSLASGHIKKVCCCSEEQQHLLRLYSTNAHWAPPGESISFCAKN